MQSPIASQIGPVIDSLASRLKMPTEFVYHAMRRQVYIDAITITVFMLILAVVWKFYIGFWNKYHDDMDYDIPCFLGGLVLMVISVVTVVFALHQIGAVLNPDYAVISKILDSIK